MSFDPELHASVASELHAQGSAIAARSIEAQFAAQPGLAESLGPRGVEASLRDAVSTVNHLAEAIALGDLDAFASYVAWLQGVLVNMVHLPASLLGEHLGYLAHAVEERTRSDSAALAGQYIAHALSRLGEEAP